MNLRDQFKINLSGFNMGNSEQRTCEDAHSKHNNNSLIYGPVNPSRAHSITRADDEPSSIWGMDQKSMGIGLIQSPSVIDFRGKGGDMCSVLKLHTFYVATLQQRPHTRQSIQDVALTSPWIYLLLQFQMRFKVKVLQD